MHWNKTGWGWLWHQHGWTCKFEHPNGYFRRRFRCVSIISKSQKWFFGKKKPSQDWKRLLCTKHFVSGHRVGSFSGGIWFTGTTGSHPKMWFTSEGPIIDAHATAIAVAGLGWSRHARIAGGALMICDGPWGDLVGYFCSAWSFIYSWWLTYNMIQYSITRSALWSWIHYTMQYAYHMCKKCIGSTWLCSHIFVYMHHPQPLHDCLSFYNC